MAMPSSKMYVSGVELHRMGQNGFMFDRNINPDDTFGVTGNAHMPKEDPEDPNSTTLESVFEDLTAYKNRNGGIWGRGEMHVFRNVKLADNAMGFTHASGSAGRDPSRRRSSTRCSSAKPTTSATADKRFKRAVRVKVMRGSRLMPAAESVGSG